MTPTEMTLDQPAAVRTRRAPRKTPAKPAAARHTATAEPVASSNGEQALAQRSKPVDSLSESWFSMVRSGQESALDTARKFVDLVDVVLPVQGGEDSRRRRVIDGAFDLADRAAAAQLGMMRSAVQSAVLVYVDVDVNVDTDVDAFNGIDVGVDVTVPTDVGAFKTRGSNQM
jgi:hypothetical protein